MSFDPFFLSKNTLITYYFSILSSQIMLAGKWNDIIVYKLQGKKSFHKLLKVFSKPQWRKEHNELCHLFRHVRLALTESRQSGESVFNCRSNLQRENERQEAAFDLPLLSSLGPSKPIRKDASATVSSHFLLQNGSLSSLNPQLWCRNPARLDFRFSVQNPQC